MASKTFGELLDRMCEAFTAHNMEQAEAEAIAIIAELRDCNRLEAKIERDVPLTDALYEQGLQIIDRRLANEPWQYIFERAYFRDLTLKVTNDVLIPRPETELLAEWCIEYLPQHGRLLDLGTGSGAIAIAIATERRDSQVTACDLSEKALQIAKFNVQRSAPGRVELLQSDLFSNLSGRRFDIIAANLPYVTEDEYTFLSAEVRDFEPKLALTAPDDGLNLIKQAVEHADEYLTANGAIIMEMSEFQTAIVADIMSASDKWCAIEIIQDYTHRNRFVAARMRRRENEW